MAIDPKKPKLPNPQTQVPLGAYKYRDDPTVFRADTNQAFSSPDEFLGAGGRWEGIEVRERPQSAAIPKVASVPAPSPSGDPVNQLAALREKYLSTFTPSKEAVKAQDELTNLRENTRMGVVAKEGQGRGIPLQLVRGLQGKLLEQGQIQEQTLEQRLANELSRRELEQKAVQTELGFAESDFEREEAKRREQAAQQEKAMMFGLEQGVETPFVNIGGTFYRTSDLKPFSSMEDFTGEAGIASEAEARSKGLLSDLSASNKDERALVMDLASKYFDAGISPSDSLASAQQKAQNSRIYRDQVRPPGGGGGGSSSAGSGTSAVDSWVGLIQSGAASISNVPAALKNAVASALSGAPAAGNPQALEMTTQALEALSALESHPGLKGAVGAKGWDSLFGMKGNPIGGTKAAGFVAELDRARSLLTLPNLQYLKGLGAMSDREFATIQAASAALNRDMSESDFRREIARIKESLQSTISKLQSGAPASAGAVGDPLGIRN